MFLSSFYNFFFVYFSSHFVFLCGHYREWWIFLSFFLLYVTLSSFFFNLFFSFSHTYFISFCRNAFYSKEDNFSPLFLIYFSLSLPIFFPSLSLSLSLLSLFHITISIFYPHPLSFYSFYHIFFFLSISLILVFSFPLYPDLTDIYI